MSLARLPLPCPECGASSRAAQTHRGADGQPLRWRKGDNGHGFIVRGGPPLVEMGRKRKTPIQHAPRIAPTTRMLTEWRPYPFLESVARAVL